MPKKQGTNKDLTQKVDKNRPKTKQEKKDEKKKHKQVVIEQSNQQPITHLLIEKRKSQNGEKRVWLILIFLIKESFI